MLIKIEEETFEVSNNSIRIKDLFEKINSILEEKKFQFKYLIIDGVEVQESFDTYILEHLSEIKQIEVVCQVLSILVEETLSEAFNYLQNGIPIINDLSEKFYQNPGKQEWISLGYLIEGLDWLIITREKIDGIGNLTENIKSYEKWNEYVLCLKKIEAIIPDFMEAVENQDSVLVGDILKYEILDSFKEAVNYLRFLISATGDGYVS